jgi:hypothetical protein
VLAYGPRDDVVLEIHDPLQVVFMKHARATSTKFNQAQQSSATVVLLLEQGMPSTKLALQEPKTLLEAARKALKRSAA